MAGGGGAAEVEIPVEVQEGAVLGVQGGGEDQGAGIRREAVVIPATRKNLSLLSPGGGQVLPVYAVPSKSVQLPSSRGAFRAPATP